MRGPKVVHPARVHARGVVPQPAPRRKRGQAIDELPSIDTTWLDGVVGGRQLPPSGANPQIVAMMKALGDALAATGKTLADKSSQQMSQMLEMIGKMKDKHGK